MVVEGEGQAVRLRDPYCTTKTASPDDELFRQSNNLKIIDSPYYGPISSAVKKSYIQRSHSTLLKRDLHILARYSLNMDYISIIELNIKSQVDTICSDYKDNTFPVK